MPLKENLINLTGKFQGKIGPRLESEKYPDVDQIVKTIADIQGELLDDITVKFLIDPAAATASIGVTWFLLGLLYSHEFGTPSEVVRIFQE